MHARAQTDVGAIATGRVGLWNGDSTVLFSRSLAGVAPERVDTAPEMVAKNFCTTLLRRLPVRSWQILI